MKLRDLTVHLLTLCDLTVLILNLFLVRNFSLDHNKFFNRYVYMSMCLKI